MKYSILLVDDDQKALESRKAFLEYHGFEVDTAETGAQAIKLVSEDEDKYALLILDYRLKEETGAAIAQELLKINPSLYILMYSGDASAEVVRSTFKSGALDFIDKGTSNSEFLEAIKNYCLKFDETSRTICSKKAKSENEQIIASVGMVGQSAALVEVAKTIFKYRNSLGENIFINGETGVGKELVARAIHNGPSNKFFAVNCAMFSERSDFVESELFGYEKGAFTGANNRKIGIFEQASGGGTVFLDEIHHLNFLSQAKLLRALQEKKIRRLGGGPEYQLDFRLVCAAKPEILQKVEKGEFASDLFYRLHVLDLKIPPLRERKTDIEPLVAHFTDRYNLKYGKKKKFLAKTVSYLKMHDWPGNVRDLEGVVTGLLLNTDADKIEPHHLEGKFFSRAATSQGVNLSYEEFKLLQERREQEYLALVLRSSSTKYEAANKLGIPTSTLQSKLKKFGLLDATLRDE
ncbi:MAG: sigma-54-dependent transcriptional regulator [Bacteriovoracia bacterium]